MDDGVMLLVRVGTVAASLTAVIILGRHLLNGARKLGRFFDAWEGDGKQSGVIDRLERIEQEINDGRERMSRVEAELTHNGGGSVKDAVTELRADIRALREAFEKHADD